MIDTFILDLDGTVLDARRRLYRCYADILARHGYVAMAPDEYWNMRRGRTSQQQQLEKSNAAALHTTFMEEWLEHIEEEAYLRLDILPGGVYEKLSELHAEGKKLVLATMRKNRPALLSQLEWLGIRRFFAEVITCPHSAGGTGKARAVMALSLPAARCLWVGDTEADVEAARFMGCKVWAVSSGIRTAGYLASLRPDFLSQSLVDDVGIPESRPAVR